MVDSKSYEKDKSFVSSKRSLKPGYYRDHTNDTEHFDHFYKSMLLIF